MRQTLAHAVWCRRVTSSYVNVLRCSVLKKDTEMSSWHQVLCHHAWLIAPQGITDLGVQCVKRHGGVCLTGQDQQWMHVLLWTALGPFGRVLCDQDHGPHVRGLAVGIRLHGWRQKLDV